MRRVASIPIPNTDSPAGAFGFGSLWVTSTPGGAPTGTLRRIDSRTNRVVATIRVGLDPVGVAVDASGVWVANAGACAIVGGCSPGGNQPPRQPTFPKELSVWRINPSTNAVAAKIAVPYPIAIASGFGSIWVGSEGNQTAITRIDERTDRVTTIHAPYKVIVTSIAAGADAVWVLCQDPNAKGHLLKIDPGTNRIAFDVPADNDFQDVIAVGGIHVFMTQGTTAGEGSVSQIDRRTGKLAPFTNQAQLRFPKDVVVAGGRLWSVNDGGWVQAVNANTMQYLGETLLDSHHGVSAGPWLAIGAGTLWTALADGGRHVVRLAPVGGMLEPADSQEPAAGVCGTMVGDVATFELNIDTPGPRCGRVGARQHLSLVNDTHRTVEIQFLGVEYVLESGETRTFPERFGDVWQRGDHELPTDFYAGSGPEIWFVQDS